MLCDAKHFESLVLLDVWSDQHVLQGWFLVKCVLLSLLLMSLVAVMGMRDWIMMQLD